MKPIFPYGHILCQEQIILSWLVKFVVFSFSWNFKCQKQWIWVIPYAIIIIVKQKYIYEFLSSSNTFIESDLLV
jgi:hypothetical protein